MPFPPGGPTDTLSRILAAKLGDVWKAGIVIENKGGAAGAIGADLAAKAAPDGYTIQLGTQSTNGSNKIFYPNLPYDPIADFEALTLLGTACMALVIPTSIPAGTAQELVEWIKKQDGVAYAATTGSSQHIAAELLVKRAGLKATLVPYRGSAQAQPDLMAGRIAFMFDNLPSALPQARAGRVKARRRPARCARPRHRTPDDGRGGFRRFRGRWMVRHVRAVQDAEADRRQAVGRHQQGAEGPDSLEKWKTLGFDPIGSTPAEFARRQKDDLAYWKQMIEYTG